MVGSENGANIMNSNELKCANGPRNLMIEKIKLMLEVLIKHNNSGELSAIEQLALVIGIRDVMLPDDVESPLYIKELTNLIPFIKSICKLEKETENVERASIQYYMGLEVAGIMGNLAHGPTSVTEELLYDSDDNSELVSTSAACELITNYLTVGDVAQQEMAIWFFTSLASGKSIELSNEWGVDVITKLAAIYKSSPIKR